MDEKAEAMRGCRAETPNPIQKTDCNLRRGQYPGHSPNLFQTWSLPLEYKQDCRCPTWAALPVSILPQEEIRLIQEWFGYVLSGDNQQTKIHVACGTAPKRQRNNNTNPTETCRRAELGGFFYGPPH